MATLSQRGVCFPHFQPDPLGERDRHDRKGTVVGPERLSDLLPCWLNGLWAGLSDPCPWCPHCVTSAQAASLMVESMEQGPLRGALRTQRWGPSPTRTGGRDPHLEFCVLAPVDGGSSCQVPSLVLQALQWGLETRSFPSSCPASGVASQAPGCPEFPTGMQLLPWSLSCVFP